MKNYKCTHPQGITLPAGSVMKLSPEQARRRKHIAEPVEGEEGVYKATHPNVFKNEETFGTAVELDKGMMLRCECLDPDAGADNEKTNKEKPKKKKPTKKKPEGYAAMDRDALFKRATDRGLNPVHNLGAKKLIIMLEEADKAAKETGDGEGDGDQDPPPDYTAMDRDELWAKAFQRELSPDPEIDRDGLISLLKKADEEEAATSDGDNS